MKPTFLLFLLDVIIKLQSNQCFKFSSKNQLLDFLYHSKGMFNANLDGPNLWVYSMFANESVLALNSLNLCQHRIARHRDIAGMYRPMLAFIQTNRDIEIKFHKSHTWTWMALVSPFLFIDEHSFSLIQVKFLTDMAFGGLNHFKVNSRILKLLIYEMFAKYFPC